MSKKVIVSKEWHKRAMAAMNVESENVAFVNGLRDFLYTELSPCQQKELESKIENYMNNI